MCILLTYSRYHVGNRKGFDRVEGVDEVQSRTAWLRRRLSRSRFDQSKELVSSSIRKAREEWISCRCTMSKFDRWFCEREKGSWRECRCLRLPRRKLDASCHLGLVGANISLLKNLDLLEPHNLIPNGVWSFEDILRYGEEHKQCPYFTARRMVR